MKQHRKLFPAATNKTISECPYFCDQTCPYNCYPDSDYYNFLPPPPQPPPSSSLIPPDHRISPFVIILISVLASFFLLVSYFIITSKSCPNWSANNRHQGQVDDTEDEENRIDHPIWFISTAGLQQSIINSITVCKYKKGEGLIEGTECSVCLSEFQQDETLRLLPKCNHAFHIPCIDTWLRSHTNCPLCRAHIVNANENHPLTTPNQNLEDSNPEIDLESGDSEPSENRRAAGEESARATKEDERVDLGIICEAQTMRRSLSMDSLIGKTLATDPVNRTGNWGVRSKNEGGKMSSSSSIAQHLHMSPVAMKRSYSCGGRFFCTRQNRNLTCVLPL